MSIKNTPIIFEDENLLIVDKPSGLIVNNSQTAPDDTLQNRLLEEFGFEDYMNVAKKLLNDSSEISAGFIDDESEISEEHRVEEFISRTGIIHRLDKGTSGALAIAKNPDTFISIQQQFKDRLVKKEYLAICFGKISDENFIVDAPLKRDRSNRMRYAISADGKYAHTRFELISVQTIDGRQVSAVKCFPSTGRTHQIRVHLCALNHTILGDRLYSGRKQYKWAESLDVERMLLHAHTLSFTYKDTEMLFESPIPKEFLQFLPI